MIDGWIGDLVELHGKEGSLLHVQGGDGVDGQAVGKHNGYTDRFMVTLECKSQKKHLHNWPEHIPSIFATYMHPKLLTLGIILIQHK